MKVSSALFVSASSAGATDLTAAKDLGTTQNAASVGLRGAPVAVSKEATTLSLQDNSGAARRARSVGTEAEQQDQTTAMQNFTVALLEFWNYAQSFDGTSEGSDEAQRRAQTVTEEQVDQKTAVENFTVALLQFGNYLGLFDDSDEA